MNTMNMNGQSIKIGGQQTANIRKEGEKKPVDKPKAPQYIKHTDTTPIQYLD